MTTTDHTLPTVEQPSKAPRILSLIHAEPGWVATVYYSEKHEDGSSTVTGSERHRVLGWALVENHGRTHFEAVYVESPGFPTCASLHNGFAPDHVEAWAHFEPDATDITDPRTDR